MSQITYPRLSIDLFSNAGSNKSSKDAEFLSQTKFGSFLQHRQSSKLNELINKNQIPAFSLIKEPRSGLKEPPPIDLITQTLKQIQDWAASISIPGLTQEEMAELARSAARILDEYAKPVGEELYIGKYPATQAIEKILPACMLVVKKLLQAEGQPTDLATGIEKIAAMLCRAIINQPNTPLDKIMQQVAQEYMDNPVDMSLINPLVNSISRWLNEVMAEGGIPGLDSQDMTFLWIAYPDLIREYTQPIQDADGNLVLYIGDYPAEEVIEKILPDCMIAVKKLLQAEGNSSAFLYPDDVLKLGSILCEQLIQNPGVPKKEIVEKTVEQYLKPSSPQNATR